MIPEPLQPESLYPLLRSSAVDYKLDPVLVAAVIEQESSWNPWAVRYEAAFRVKYISPLRLTPTEEVVRSMSWGLMQVMGQTAREFGFTGPIPSLCDPVVLLPIGCKVLSHMIEINKGNEYEGLLSWNGGSNPKYASQVLARLSHYANI